MSHMCQMCICGRCRTAHLEHSAQEAGQIRSKNACVDVLALSVDRLTGWTLILVASSLTRASSAALMTFIARSSLSCSQ